MRQETSVAKDPSEESLDLGPPMESESTTVRSEATTSNNSEATKQITVETISKHELVLVDGATTREIALAGIGLVLILAVLLLIKRNLELWCASHQVPPANAKLAGWFFLLGMMLLALSVTCYLLYPLVFFKPMFYGPIVTVGLGFLIIAFLNTRR